MLAKVSPAVLMTIVLMGLAPALQVWAQPPAGVVRMQVEVEYLPVFPATGDQPGDLFVYLDGDLLVWVLKGGQYAAPDLVRFERDLAPGPHVLRFAHETHKKLSRGWDHETRVSPVEIFFQLEAGGRGFLRVKVVEKFSAFKSNQTPISVQVEHEGRMIQNLEGGGRPLRTWQTLCEDIEANFAPGKKIPKKARAKLEQCVRWADLWKSLDGEVPSREAVHGILQRYDYQPRTYKRFN